MFYVLDENNNKVEALDKEGVFAVLSQAIEDGSITDLVADAAFVSKLKCCVSGVTNKFAFVTTAKYNELVTAGLVEPNTLYYITDDTSQEDLDKALTELTETVAVLTPKVADYEQFKSDLLSGEQSVYFARRATIADIASKAEKLTGLTEIAGAANSNGIWGCDIMETGIYLAKVSQTYSNVRRIDTGIIVIPDLNTYAAGCISLGELRYAYALKEIAYTHKTGAAVDDFKLYRLGDI